jgi:hypothetical protein
MPVYLHLASLMVSKAAIARKYARGMNAEAVDEYRARGFELLLPKKSV